MTTAVQTSLSLWSLAAGTSMVPINPSVCPQRPLEPASCRTPKLLCTAEKTGLTESLSTELGEFRKPLTHHDSGKILLDLAVSLTISGGCLTDIDPIRVNPKLFGEVASDPTVSRLITTLPAQPEQALAAIGRARATARSNARTAADVSAPDRYIDDVHP